MSKTYNAAIGIPQSLLNELRTTPTFKLTYSKHALRAALDDKNGFLHPDAFPREFDISWGRVIEVTVDEDNYIEKIVVRRLIDEARDLVLVILPATGVVKTLWINFISDTHKTLDITKYAKP